VRLGGHASTYTHTQDFLGKETNLGATPLEGASPKRSVRTNSQNKSCTKVAFPTPLLDNNRLISSRPDVVLVAPIFGNM